MLISFLIGIFLGANIGFLVLAICVVAADADRETERHHKMLRR